MVSAISTHYAMPIALHEVSQRTCELKRDANKHSHTTILSICVCLSVHLCIPQSSNIMRAIGAPLWLFLKISMLLMLESNCKYTAQTTTFYLRHYFAKCLQYDTTRQVFVFTSICREKFQWSSGAKLLHVPTNKCLNVNSTTDGSFLGLSSNCDSTSTLFQYDQANRLIIHLNSGKCLHPQTGSANPSANKAVVIKSGCNLDTNKYYFRPNAYYIIRHFGGHCWVYDSSSNYIRLRNPNACDRFHYENDYHLRHVNTGKCVTYDTVSTQYLILTENCTSPKTIWKQIGYSNIQQTPGYCVHPRGGSSQPNFNEYLHHYPGCGEFNKLRFYFYDERGKVFHLSFCNY